MPYLHDESQTVARALDAQVTPHLFILDAEHTLVWTGAPDADPGNEDEEHNAELAARGAGLRARRLQARDRAAPAARLLGQVEAVAPRHADRAGPGHRRLWPGGESSARRSVPAGEGQPPRARLGFGAVRLSPADKDKLLLSMAGLIARERRARGVKLNHPEAVALLSCWVIEGARDGRSVADLMAAAATC